MPQSYEMAGLQNDNIASDGEESKSRLNLNLSLDIRKREYVFLPGEENACSTSEYIE